MSDPITWEGVAASFLAPFGDIVIDPRLLCVPYDLELVPVADRSGRSSCTRGAYVKFPVLAPLQRQAGVIAHELGHVALREHGEDSSDERAASYVGAAIIAPRRPLLAALRRVGPDLDALQPLFEHASPELLARRIADIGDYACTVVYAHGRKVKRHGPNAPPMPPKLDRHEVELVEHARETGRPVFVGDTRVWWVPWPGYDHAILLRSVS